MHHAEENSPFKKVMPESSILRETIPYAFPTVALQVPTRGLQGNDDVLKHPCVLYVLCTRGMMVRSFLGDTLEFLRLRQLKYG